MNKLPKDVAKVWARKAYVLNKKEGWTLRQIRDFFAKYKIKISHETIRKLIAGQKDTMDKPV